MADRTRYMATQVLIRISHADEAVVHMAAEELALVTASRLSVDGATVTFGRGLWKGEYEHGAVIEIVTEDAPINEDMDRIRNHVLAMGLTAFVTVAAVIAHELY